MKINNLRQIQIHRKYFIVFMVSLYCHESMAMGNFFRSLTDLIGITEKAPDIRITPITGKQAVLHIEAWAKEKGRTSAMQTITNHPNGDFNVEVGAAGFRFIENDGTLLVSGYVASGQVDLTNPRTGQSDWDWLISIATLQPATLGEGELELYTGTVDPRTKKPAVYLTKKFTSLPADVDQFVREVGWVVRWATYWRDERWNEIFSSRTNDQLKKEAVEAQAWALNKHPRPW